MTVKLRQGQLWKQGNAYLRIVQLERLEVAYKSLPHPTSKEGTSHHVSKKEFCRLIKQAELLIPDKKPAAPQGSKPAPAPNSEHSGPGSAPPQPTRKA